MLFGDSGPILSNKEITGKIWLNFAQYGRLIPPVTADTDKALLLATFYTIPITVDFFEAQLRVEVDGSLIINHDL